MSEIKDFIYLDMNKVSSLYSQLSGGIVQSVESSQVKSKDQSSLRSYDFKIFKHDATGIESGSEQLKEVRISHHEVYNDLERKLFEGGYAVEIGVDVSEQMIAAGKATEVFENALCVKAEGRIVLEDYERIARIANNHNSISEFINHSVVSSFLSSPEYINLKNVIDSSKERLKIMKGGEEKTSLVKQVKELENKIEVIKSEKRIKGVESWIIEGLKTWVSVFLPNVFNVRLYPFQDTKNFHVMSNVKRNFFLDDDTESVHYLFGSMPTIKVSMLGVVTSVPKKNGEEFNPMKEFQRDSADVEDSDDVAVESGFRGVFRGFDGFEGLIRTCRYPRIMVQPLAIYRAVKRG